MIRSTMTREEVSYGRALTSTASRPVFNYVGTAVQLRRNTHEPAQLLNSKRQTQLSYISPARARGVCYRRLATAPESDCHRSADVTSLALVEMREDDLEESRELLSSGLHALTGLRAY